jgi:hemolysin activation/secretion protein
MAEQSVMRGIGARTLATLTGAAGTSVGDLVPQRLWYLGGGPTLRGYRAGELAGNAFWFGRAELVRGSSLVRPAVFFDVGWSGDRESWEQANGVRRGAGIGVAALDGLARLDVARGLSSDGRWRADLYFELR